MPLRTGVVAACISLRRFIFYLMSILALFGNDDEH